MMRPDISAYALKITPWTGNSNLWDCTLGSLRLGTIRYTPVPRGFHCKHLTDEKLCRSFPKLEEAKAWVEANW